MPRSSTSASPISNPGQEPGHDPGQPCGQEQDQGQIHWRPRTDGVDRPEPTLRYGDRIGDYLVNGFAGVGATSYVYRGRRLDSFEPVAIKVLHPHLLADAGKRDQFLREARMMMALHHANVVSFHEILELVGGQLAFVMDYIEGETLEDWAGGEAIGDETTLACLFVDILRGLNHAHRHGLVHRDLKPANVLITFERGRYVAKIIDFGVARYADQPASAEDRKKIVGTAAYISPEEVRDPDTVCAASDIYSIGVMMYEAACGRRPFEGMPIRDLMNAHVQREPQSPRALNPNLTPGFEQVILRTLTKTPEGRITSATELIGALESAMYAAMVAPVADPCAATDAGSGGEGADGATLEWSRAVDPAAVADRLRFLMMLRQCILFAMTAVLTTGARSDGTDPHYLNRHVDAHTPIF